MIEPRLFVCSGSTCAKTDPLAKDRLIVALDSIGKKANVNIKLENVARVFHKHLSPRLVDLLEIAAYVFTADCATSRGRGWVDGAIEGWGRDFRFLVPVRDLAFWDSEEVKTLLVESLEFLSNDRYSFAFEKLTIDRNTQQYLDFGALEDWPFYEPERVLMFSGGLDSLAGTVETARSGSKAVLVSHRSVSTVDSRQRKLFTELQREFPDSLIHIPVWINKNENFSRESTQRTRSFLYSALGTVVAQSIRAGGTRFFENGIVSLNFPVADEALRARASRTTHPFALEQFSTLYSLVTERSFPVDNPYVSKTKADVVRVIAAQNASHLIGHTCSCAHSMFKSKAQWHCGTCSQCIDRRFAIVSTGLTAYDLSSDYVSDVFLGPRKDGYEKNMAVDYVRHGFELDSLSERDLAVIFNAEIGRAIQGEGGGTAQAESILALHKRHGEAIKRVIQDQIAEHAAEVFEGSIDDSSLLALVIGKKHLEPVWRRYCQRLICILRDGVPTACATHKPKDEPHFQQLCDGILKSSGNDLLREFPFMRWSSCLTKPDWCVEPLRVLIEAKYIRRREDIHPITEAISSDITKYGDNKYRVLYLVYDPHHLVDERSFSEPILKHANMTVGFVR